MPPKTVRERKLKRKPKSPQPELKFRSRGPFKCVTNKGTACKGVHDALRDALFSSWNYERAKADGTLQTFDPPPATTFYPTPQTKNTRRLPYSKQQGCKLDAQMSAVVEWHVKRKQKIPLRAFYDSVEMHRIARLLWPAPGRALQASRRVTDMTPGEYKRILAQMKQQKRMFNVRNSLLPETESLIRFLAAHDLDPISTQDVVAKGRLGTRIDLVCVKDGLYRVIELKTGCSKNFSHGRKMASPCQDIHFSTHNEHLLQTGVNDALYRHVHPQRAMGPPLLLRVDKEGVHAYRLPQWVRACMPALMQKLV